MEIKKVQSTTNGASLYDIDGMKRMVVKEVTDIAMADDITVVFTFLQCEKVYVFVGKKPTQTMFSKAYEIALKEWEREFTHVG